MAVLKYFLQHYLQKIQATLSISDMETVIQILFPNLPKKGKICHRYKYIYNCKTISRIESCKNK